MSAQKVSLVLTIDLRGAVRGGHLQPQVAAQMINAQGPVPPGATVRLHISNCRSVGNLAAALAELAPAGHLEVTGTNSAGLRAMASALQAAAEL